MPELPEVEFARRQLLRRVAGRAIVEARVVGPGVEAPRGALARWSGAKTADVLRRGKTMLWVLEGGADAALLHFGMTGSFVRLDDGAPPPKHTRVLWRFDDGRGLALADPRRFGRVAFGRADDLRADRLFARAAADPLEDACDASTLVRALGDARVPLKVALMDQERLLGLGNIHAAEACFRARLDPRRPCSSLRAAEFERLWESVKTTLSYGLATLGDLDEDVRYAEPGESNPFLVYDREGLPCPGCARPLVRFAQGGRSTFACLSCQR